MSKSQESLLTMLMKEAAAHSVSGAFAHFLDANINIATGVRGRASDSHNRVRNVVVDESDADPEFPRILRDEDADFLGGSFARHTKIWPLDDIDIYFPVDGSGLVYTQRGATLPYTVVSDDPMLENPLLRGGSRWMDGSTLSSKKLIDGFAKVLRRKYPSTTRVRRAGEAVNITTTAFGFDIVPCFLLRPLSTLESAFYLIPDGDDGWIRTNPRVDNDVSVTLQRQNNKSHRPAVKLVKWWNENRFGSKFDSYYVELAVMQALKKLNAAGVMHTSVAEATTHALASVSAAVVGGNLVSWIPHAPDVEAPSLTNSERFELTIATQCASDALAKQHAGDTKGSLKKWASVFGDTFPSE